jgi:hypothetical protein
MAFTPITTAEITTGEPVSNNTQTKIKENFDNLDARATALEGGGNTVYPPLVFRVNGSYINYVMNGLLKTTLNFNITVTGVRILIDTAGASGTTEIDLKYKRGAGAYTSIFTTKPSVPYSAGNDSISTNAVLSVGEVHLQAGDILRLDVTSAQSATARNFTVRLDYTKT